MFEITEKEHLKDTYGKKSSSEPKVLFSDVTKDKLDTELRSISKGMKISELHKDEPMEEYTHRGGSHPRKKTDMAMEQGFVQLGYSEKSKEIIMAIERRTNLKRNAAFEHERKVEDKSSDRSRRPRVIAAKNHDNAATGLRYNALSNNRNILNGLLNKATKTNSTTMDVLPFLETGREKDLKDQLFQSKKELEAERSKNMATEVLSIQETLQDKKIDKLNTILSRKQEKKLKFRNSVKRTQDNIKELLIHTMDDTLDIMLKKKALREAEIEETLVPKEEAQEEERAVKEGRDPVS